MTDDHRIDLRWEYGLLAAGALLALGSVLSRNWMALGACIAYTASKFRYIDLVRKTS
jgi:hypothetical protein